MLFRWLTERLDSISDSMRTLQFGQLQLAARLDKLIDLLTPPAAATASISLGAPQPAHQGEREMAAKKLVRSGPPVDFSQLQTVGGILSLADAKGNPVTFDPTLHTAAWSSSDPTILAVATPDAAHPENAKISTVDDPAKPGSAKLGSGTVSALVTITASGVTLPVATSPMLTVSSTVPATADITLQVSA